MSDGKWENSRAIEGYWPYIEIVKKGKNVFLVVSENMKLASRPMNKFDDMPDDKVKIWVANKIKEVIKDEGLDWERGNREETDYLSTSWRKSKKAATVSDCYYVYEILKGRNAARHAEYNIKENTMNLTEAKEILKRNGYLLKENNTIPKSRMDREETYLSPDLVHYIKAPALNCKGVKEEINDHEISKLFDLQPTGNDTRVLKWFVRMGYDENKNPKYVLLTVDTKGGLIQVKDTKNGYFSGQPWNVLHEEKINSYNEYGLQKALDWIVQLSQKDNL